MLGNSLDKLVVLYGMSLRGELGYYLKATRAIRVVAIPGIQGVAGEIGHNSGEDSLS